MRELTKAETRPHAGTVAADPRILPLGTRIRVLGAGPCSGTYMVTDTGPSVAGRKIAIFVPSAHEAKRFGKKRVRVQVLEWGPGKQDAASKEAR